MAFENPDAHLDSPFQPIHQPSVVEKIIETFKTLLIQGELKPGQRLPAEQELARQLGVGRSAIREAMKVLQALGVITIRQGDGTYIVETISSAMLELRRLLEIGYCELAAQNASADDWREIEQAALSLERYIEAGGNEADDLVRLDLNFPFTVLEATHNPLVILRRRTVEELFFASIRKTYAARPNNRQWAIESHREIMHAMRSEESHAIRMAIENSLIYWKEEV